MVVQSALKVMFQLPDTSAAQTGAAKMDVSSNAIRILVIGWTSGGLDTAPNDSLLA
jgi:hypothetical protein